MSQENLLLAIQHNDLETLKQLLLHSRNSSLNIKFRDPDKNSLLHLAVLEYRNQKTDENRYKNLKLGEFLVEAGCDVHARNKDGLIPLHYACHYGIEDWIFILTCYSHWNCPLPFPLKLKMVINAMRGNLAEKICCNHNGNRRIIYDESDFKYFLNAIRFLRPYQFHLFLRKYPKIVEEFLRSCDFLNGSLKIVVCRIGESVKNGHVQCCRNTLEIMKILLKNDRFVDILIQKKNLGESTIYYLTYLFKILKIPLRELTEIVCSLLTRGLNVTSEDFEAVFSHFGCCNLFKQFLKREIKIVHQMQSIMPILFLDVGRNFVDFYKENRNDIQLFNSKNLENYFAGWDVKRITDNVNVGAVPSLLELSRNASRKYLVDKYKIYHINNFRQLLSQIPLAEVYSKILTYETPLYY